MAFIDTNELDVKEPRPGWKGRFFNSDNMTFAHYTVAADAWIHEHSHPNEEVWTVIEGELEITLDGETRVGGPGYVAVVPPNIPHSLKALSASKAIVADYPLRRSVGGVDID